jgi:hypothetical protein
VEPSLYSQRSRPGSLNLALKSWDAVYAGQNSKGHSKCYDDSEDLAITVGGL